LDADDNVVFGQSDGTVQKLSSNGTVAPLGQVSGFVYRIQASDNGTLLVFGENALWQITPNAPISLLHTFELAFQGKDLLSATEAEDGVLIGSTRSGGLFGFGTVFRLDPANGEFAVLKHLPFVNSSRQSLMWVNNVLPMLPNPFGTNLPPLARDDLVDFRALKVKDPAVGTEPEVSIPVLENDRAQTGTRLTITTVGQPAWGAATLDPLTRRISYRSLLSSVHDDTFTYTVTNDAGGTATARVWIRQTPAGRYDGEVKTPRDDSTGDPGTSVGQLTVRIGKNKAVAAKLSLTGKSYTFTGKLNELNRVGKLLHRESRSGPMVAIQLWMHNVNNEWVLEATTMQDWRRSSATCYNTTGG
jgi:uncharacterized repeat protein (TIGR03803 family)